MRHYSLGESMLISNSLVLGSSRILVVCLVGFFATACAKAEVAADDPEAAGGSAVVGSTNVDALNPAPAATVAPVASNNDGGAGTGAAANVGNDANVGNAANNANEGGGWQLPGNEGAGLGLGGLDLPCESMTCTLTCVATDPNKMCGTCNGDQCVCTDNLADCLGALTGGLGGLGL
jgi:hypothetical protein